MPLQTSPWKAPACAHASLRASAAKAASFALVLVALVAVLLAPRSAYAQTVTQTMGTSILDYFPGGGPSSHPNNVNATWISYTDCENDVEIYVPLTVSVPSSGFANYSIAAYATTISGTDCGVSTSRSGATGVCWQVALSPGVLTSIPVQQATYHVRVRDLLRNIGQAAGVGLTYPAGGGTEAACHVAAQSGAIPLSLQFVVSDLGGNESSNVQIGLNVELIGPAPPTGITLGVGEGLLKLSWTPVSDPNTQGFNIFIDPLPGHEGESADAAAVVSDVAPKTIDVCVDEGVVDGGVDETGDAISIPVVGMCHQVTSYEAGAIQATACPSSILTSGVTGVIDSGTATSVTTTVDGSTTSTGTNDAGVTTVVQGTAPTLAQLAQIDSNAQVGGGTQTTATIKGLKDGYVYTVAIAAIDNLNDNGPLSVPQCATPSPIDDFYSQYRADGGLAGGSFCALEGVGIPAGTGAFGMIMIGACVALLRRRRDP